MSAVLDPVYSNENSNLLHFCTKVIRKLIIDNDDIVFTDKDPFVSPSLGSACPDDGDSIKRDTGGREQTAIECYGTI